MPTRLELDMRRLSTIVIMSRMQIEQPTDAQIQAAEVITLVDRNCPCWSMHLYPPNIVLTQLEADAGLRIPIDSSNLSVIEAWSDRVKKVRPLSAFAETA